MLTYILPIRAHVRASDEFFSYLQWLAPRVEVIVVDGSPRDVAVQNSARCQDRVVHIPVDADVSHFVNGKVAGVITGLRRAAGEMLIVADDDVRYDEVGLTAMADALSQSDVVRPQNYFDPLPWHACVDTARTLLNRVSGGDWPGTLGVRRRVLEHAGGYDGNALFENLELVRTVVAAGGTESVPFGLYVRRLPPTTRHFFSQRVRQAYDEFARPARLLAWLALAPLIGALFAAHAWVSLIAGTVASVIAAAVGRRRAGGHRIFPIAAVFAAPVWLLERAVCAWIAVGLYLTRGGVRYHGQIVSLSATPLRALRRRLQKRGNVLARP